MKTKPALKPRALKEKVSTLLKQVRTTQKCLKPVQEILPSLASFSSESLMVSFSAFGHTCDSHGDSVDW